MTDRSDSMIKVLMRLISFNCDVYGHCAANQAHGALLVEKFRHGTRITAVKDK
jgi:hypothetical protein